MATGRRGQIQGDGFVALLLAVVIAFAVMYIAVGILSGMSDNPDGAFTRDYVRLEGTDEFVELQSSQRGRNQTVFDSRGNAVRLNGSDGSYVESNKPVTFASDANWTVSTWARVNESAGGENMTALSLDGRVLVQYNGSQSNWTVWYYQEGGANNARSWRVNVSAPNQPGNLTHIAAQHNGTHLTIWRNATTQGDVVNTEAESNSEPIYVNSTNWNGTLEESRTFDENISDSQRESLFNNPIDPVTASPTVRLYYDRGRGTTIVQAHAGGTATLSNGSWVGGFAGNTLDEKTGPLDVTGGNDYQWEEDGPRIKPESGGELENQPIAWVDYNLIERAEAFALNLVSTFDFVATVPQILIAAFALFLLMRFRRS